ncbi:MAG: cyclic nucleotide-binding domain-containing protein [Myxococcales bacterium]|nr:cyclic nucleotide-binding domain-containing protein [Myxococcales bacterium]
MPRTPHLRATAALELQREALHKFGPTLYALRALRTAGLHEWAAESAAQWAADFGGDARAVTTLLGVVDRARTRHFIRDEVIIREGEASSHLYVVLRGDVIVERQGQGVIGRLQQGAVFGEGGLLEGARRMATVRATRGTSVMEINAQQADALCRRVPRLREDLRRQYRARMTDLLIPPGSALAGLSASQIDLLWTRLVPRRVGPGFNLAHQNRVAGEFGIILSGVADVWRRTADGGRETLGRLTAGDFFGALSLLTGEPNRVSATAVGPLQYMSLEAGDFVDLMDAWWQQRRRLQAVAEARWRPDRGAAAQDLLDDLLPDGSVSLQLPVMRCPYCGHNQVDADRCSNCGTQMPWVP